MMMYSPSSAGCVAFLILGLTISPSIGADPPVPQRWDTVVKIPRQTLTFQPTRADMTIGKAIFALYCSQPDELRVNGVSPEPIWNEVQVTAEGKFVVENRHRTAPDLTWIHVNLKEIEKNRFEFGPLHIETAGPPASPLLCMSVKVWFNEVPNQFDGLYYVNLDDRYALVSYCTRPIDSNPVKSRFGQNRVETTQEFQRTLDNPFVIRLNQRPLPAKE